MQAESLSMEKVWQAVALEERLELVARAKADGIIAAIGFLILIGSIAYGFDKILLLGFGSIGALLVVPIFSGFSWRRNKPVVVLEYLTARTIARKFAQLARFIDIRLEFIFRAEVRQLFESAQAEAIARAQESEALALDRAGYNNAWVCLFRGGAVVLSESIRGAKLEFCGSFAQDIDYRPATEAEEESEGAFVLTLRSGNKDKSILLRSRYRGALYVFDKKINHLLANFLEKRPRLSSA